ncbi:MAG: sugar phosphate isomerase/epimerase family protein [Candidatus Hadarchaeota archaeon]
MKLGRDYTNCLVLDHLNNEDRRAFEHGNLDLASVNAIGLEKAKLDVEMQLKVTQELGMSHVELDSDPPNPYVRLDQSRREEIRKAAEDAGISLSLHLPYSYVGGSICSPGEEERRTAVEFHKRCMKFASDVGAIYVNIHPGSAPFYHRLGKYNAIIRSSIVNSIVELGEFAKELGLLLHLENNTAFDGIYSELEDCISLVEELRSRGVDIYFNFDIGHWFTRADTGSQIPDPPEDSMKKIPKGYMKEVHLNDYVPGKKMFHPPIHLEWGLLKKENLKRYSEMVKAAGVEVVVLETAMKSNEQIMDSLDILKQESEYVRNIFGA